MTGFKQKTLLIGGLSLAVLSGLAQNPYPNVIYIFPDQWRNHALGFWNEKEFQDKVPFKADPVCTPHLNSFAKESFVLSAAVSNCPLSSPHRGMLLTGMYPDGSGVPLNCNSNRPISSLREDVLTISDIYSRSGYDCGYIGKLHTDFPTPNDPQNPGQYVQDAKPVWDAYTPPGRRHGFNYWYSYGTFDVHKEPHYWDTEGNRHEIREWSPKHEADKAIAYLRNENDVRDHTKPFFLMISMNPPHSPYNSLDDCMEEDYELYKNIPVADLLIRPNADISMNKASDSRYYFAAITGVDREFGRILQVLSEMNLDKNTIVVFASDHGETMCSQGIEDPKNSPYAESLNIPFLVRYPGAILPAVDDLLLSTPDIMPTLLGLSGLSEQIPETVQGKDYSSLFFKNGTVERPAGALYIQNIDGEKDEQGLVRSYFPVARGIKTSQYTLALYLDRNTHKLQRMLFFNDLSDPYQMINLDPEQEQSVFKKLCSELAVLLKNADDPWFRERILSDLIPYK